MKKVFALGLAAVFSVGLLVASSTSVNAATKIVVPWVQGKVSSGGSSSMMIAINRTGTATDANNDVYVSYGAASNDALNSAKVLNQITAPTVASDNTYIIKASDFVTLLGQHYGNTTSTGAAQGWIKVCENSACTSATTGLNVWGATFYGTSTFSGFTFSANAL